MSSNPTAKRLPAASEARQMSSIARRIHRSWILKSFRKACLGDLFLSFLLFVFALVQREFGKFNTIRTDCTRSFVWNEERFFSFPFDFLTTINKLDYVVTSRSNTVLLRVHLFPIFSMILTILSVLILFQLLGFFLSYRQDAKKIRKKLQPLNEIALKADQLSRMHFSEDKYQQIEDAISRLQPDEAELLSFGDSDLQGIEAAMNNLLVHMRETYQQQARFVNDASHELRTPIAVIQGYANMLSRWGRDDKTVLDESISAIQHESEHMKYLVEQLLFLARGDSGRTVLKKEEISLNAMMQELYEESFMIDENHPYRFKPWEEEITLTADAALIKQAARILIDNAAKYTKAGDEIFLSYGKTEDQHPYIQIQDTGIGMAESDVAHMFERFYRSDEARSYQGTGLGLSIAKWIVDKHHGHFEILSRTELGTRIRIVL